jgi:hypothetical protein
MDLVSVSYAVLWIVVLIQGFALILVFRSMGTVFLASRDGISRDGLKVGTKAPMFVGSSNGQPRSLAEFIGKWLVLVFAAPTCQICLQVLPDLGRLRDDLGDEVDILLLLRADADVAVDYQRSTGTTLPVLAIGQHGVAERYLVRVSPFVHVLDPDGMIRAKGLVNTVENVAHLLYEGGLRNERIGVHVHEHEHPSKAVA